MDTKKSPDVPTSDCDEMEALALLRKHSRHVYMTKSRCVACFVYADSCSDNLSHDISPSLSVCVLEVLGGSSCNELRWDWDLNGPCSPNEM